MARAGITYTEVAKAASRLQGESKNPTVDNVRELIGTGSRSTIMVHLRTWREKNQIESQADGLPTAIIEATKGLWSRLRAEAEEEITRKETEATAKIEAMEDILKQFKAVQVKQNEETEALKTSLAMTQAKIEELTALLQLEKTENVRLKEQNCGLDRQCSQQCEEITRLHQVAKHAQDNLFHYQETNLKMKETISLERDKERHQHLQEIRILQAQLSEMSQQKAMLEHTLKNADKTLTHAQGLIVQLQAACETLSDEASDIKIRTALLEHQNETLVDEKATYEQQIKESSEQLCNALNQINSLTNKYELLEAYLRKSEDTVRTLTDEKVFLVEEKAQISEHLKLYQSSK